ncbi:hypothetical protein Tco_0593910 [Tanacetum coccineum]
MENLMRQADKTLHMLLPKEDNVNTGKHGIGFENQNDVANPSLLNKAKELVPSLYNIDEMGNELLSDHKIISKEELKCEAKKSLKYESYFAKLKAHSISLELESQKKSSTSVQHGHDLSNKSDEAKIKFDTEDLKTINIELEFSMDRKIQDSKAEKDQFLKQIASLESKLASQDLISNKKEYNELRISYNALKAKFDARNREKGKSPMSNFSTLKILPLLFDKMGRKKAKRVGAYGGEEKLLKLMVKTTFKLHQITIQDQDAS